jgi:hypothetical protein
MPYPGYPGKQVEGCDYEDAVFTDFIKNAILQHDTEVRPTCLTACLCASALYLPLYIRLYCAFAFARCRRTVVCLSSGCVHGVFHRCSAKSTVD